MSENESLQNIGINENGISILLNNCYKSIHVKKDALKVRNCSMTGKEIVILCKNRFMRAELRLISLHLQFHSGGHISWKATLF